MIASSPIACFSKVATRRAGRCIFDITDLLRFAHSDAQLTGIPRVALTLANQALSLRPERVSIGYFDIVSGIYRILADPELIADPQALRAHLIKVTSNVRQVKFWKGEIRRTYHEVVRRANLEALRRYSALNRRPSPDIQFSFRQTDRIVCLGSGWDTLDFLAYLSSERGINGHGAELAVLIHDMIPCLFPAKMSGVHPALFKHWLAQILGMDATLLFYSSQTRQDALNWCREQKHVLPLYRNIRLGDELLLTRKAPTRDVVRQLQANDFILFVGSISGRKNGLTLLKAWQRLRASSKSTALPKLVFAGSSTAGELKNLFPEALDWLELVFIAKPNDTELGHLYRNCLFTVYPSLYEGWGLPVGESLWHGKICAASYCSSLPEVGGYDCDYFDPCNPVDIEQILWRLIFDDNYRVKRMNDIDRSRLQSWRESAQGLLLALDEPARAAANESRFAWAS
jgi:glycosyltransferase involved in cell wall biosynthesis